MNNLGMRCFATLLLDKKPCGARLPKLFIIIYSLLIKFKKGDKNEKKYIRYIGTVWSS